MQFKQNTFLVPVVLVLSFFSVWLYINQSVSNVAFSPEAVRGLSDSPVNIPSNYESIGIPQDLVVLSDNKFWYVDSQNYRIVKVSSSGTILQTVGKQGTDFGEFAETVVGITQDPGNYLYVLSYCHVYKFDLNGGYITSWGACGSGESDFSNAEGIHYDSANDVLYVSDTQHHRVLKFDSNGTYLSQFGSYGTGDGDLAYPVGIVTDAAGKIYVVDGDNHRVERFNADGTFDIKFGTNGTGDGQFTFPKDVAVATNGNIFVASQNSYKIQIFDSSGTWVSSWGEHGTEAWQFLAPRYLGFDSSGNVLVTDSFLKSIQKFSSTGTYVSAVRNSGSIGGRLTNPEGVAYDTAGNLYILDNGSSNARLQKFTNAGTYLATIADVADLGIAAYHMTIKNDKIYATNVSGANVFDTSGTLLFSFGTSGTGNGQFTEARGVGLDSTGNIYVADMENSRVQKFDATGTYISQWGTQGTGNGQFGRAQTLFIDALDNIYVGDNEKPGGGPSLNTRVQVFDTAGTYIRTIGSFGDGDGQMRQVGGTIMNSEGNLEITDTLQHRIQVMTPTGTFIGAYGAYGDGMEEFSYPAGLAVNPVTSTITIADYGNHRVQQLPGGTRIYNLNSSADVLKANDTISLVKAYINPADAGADNISSLLYFGSYVVSDFDVNMTVDRDWAAVNVTTLVNDSTSLVTNLDPSGAPGVSATHSLYIVKQEGQTTVRVCPAATQISEITLDCTTGYNLTEGDAALSTVTINGITYWKVTGLIGTGIMSEMPDVVMTAPTGVETNSVSSLTSTSASVQITVGGNGNATITERGVVYSSSAAIPSLTNSKKTISGSTGAGTAALTGLSQQTLYYVRAYATNSIGTTYGAVLSFTTLQVLNTSTAPTDVRTTSVSALTNDAANVAISVDGDGGGTIIERGVVYSSTSEAPTLTNSKKTISGTTGDGVVTLSSLSEKTKYYVRAFATNPVGTTYGNILSLTTLPEPAPIVPTGIVTLSPVAPTLSEIDCPIFTEFSVSKKIIKKGESVTVNWQTKNTESVLSAFSETGLPAVGTLDIALEQTTDLSFLADNGRCNAKKTALVQVVDTLPWVSTVSVGTGILLVEAIIALQQPAIFGNIWLSLAALFSKRKRQTWGVIYNSKTKKPLGRAIIRLLREDKTVVDTVVSDVTGTFKLTPKVGTFTVSVTLPGFDFPSKTIKTDTDGGYSNVYRGDNLIVNSITDGILLAIPLDPADLTAAESKSLQAKNTLTAITESLSYALMFGGFAYGVYIAYLYPHIYNYLILGVYSLLAFAKALMLIPKKLVGNVTLSDGNLATGIELGLFDMEFNTILYRTFTDDAGQYNFVVPNKPYTLKVLDARYKILDHGLPVTDLPIPAIKGDTVRQITKDLVLE